MIKHLQNKKHFLTLLIALLIGTGTAWAYDFYAVCPEGQTLYYNITDANNHYIALVCPSPNVSGNHWSGHTKPTGNLTIPEIVTYNNQTYTVTSIGLEAFGFCSGLTSVTIPNSVTSIGGGAFNGCSGLTSVTIPNSVTSIGESAFAGCTGLTSVTIPNSVTSIERTAFFDCSSLTSVTIPNSVTSIGFEAFGYCTGLTSVTISNSVTSILAFTFESCTSLTSVTIPNSVTSIGESAFAGCTGLTSVTIPNSVTSIGGGEYGGAFAGCSGLTSVTIPNSVTSIGGGAFNGCSGLTSVTIPNSVTSIGGGAFNGCSGLTSLCIDSEIPPTIYDGEGGLFDGVNESFPVYMPCEAVDAYTSAAWGGFSNFTCNVPITVPISPVEGGIVTGGGNNIYGQTCTLLAIANEGYAFINWMEDGAIVTTDATYSFPVSFHRTLEANFASKDNITFADANVKAICVANWDTNNDGELSYVEAAAVTSIGTVFKGNTNIQSFNELQHFIFLTAVDEQAFRNCSNLAEITIPKNVASIGSRAFWNCPALATVHFNAINCTSMYNVINEENLSVFMSSMTSHPLTNLIIGSNVQRIPDYAFRGCDHIQNLDLSALEITVGEYAFYGCTNLETLTIGEGVTSINDCAFHNCPSLTTVHFNAINCTSMGSFCVFQSGTNYDDPCPIVTLTIGENVTRIPANAFGTPYGSNIAGSLTIPNSVTSIDECAFMGCTGFTGNLIIPNSVTWIGGGAFGGCTGFTGDLIIPNSVTYIGNSAFYGCTGFTGSLIIPNSVTGIEGYAFQGCTGFTGRLIIPNSVSGIGGYAFQGCTGFTGNLIIPNSVTTIGIYAFDGCSGFTGNLIIPNSVTEIEGYAFRNCSGFAGDLFIPTSVTSIGDRAFTGCTGFTGSLTIGNSVTTIGQYAFDGCSGFTGSLIIPNSLTRIRKGAFNNCSGFTTLISENPVAPNTDYENFSQIGVFDGMDYSIPVYVPVGKISDYQRSNWGNFTNYKDQINFVQVGNANWSNEDNWSNWEGPSAEDVVCITDNCQLDADANVLYVYVADDAKVLTVNSGKTLNTTYGVHIENASQLMVEDGAQVISNIPFSGTVKKHIDAYNNNNDGWNFIASPVTEDQSISGLFPTGGSIYDLYYLDEENTYWRNYKVNAFDINHNQGYLYANQAGTDINFSGTMQPYVAEGVSIPLTKEGEGWNLVGNPFTFNAYANKPYYVINGRNIEAAASGAIAPCTGIVVKANGTENEAVRFTKDAPVTSSAPNHGSLQIVLTEASSRSAIQIDNAIVSFNEGDELGKFYFGEQDANIYLPQNDEDYAIANAEMTGETPLNFKATRNGEYTLTVNPESVEMEYLHLIDNLTGNDVDLLVTPSYTFTAKADDYASRFRLVFSANNNNLNNDDNFAFISNGQLVVNSEGTLQVFDALGRQLYVKELSTANYQLPIVTSPGVYVLRLINGENVKTQKIVIK